MPLKPGESLGHYEIIASLGAGGMGEVYRTRDTLLKREVALKVLAAEVASNPERLMRFQREAEVLASLNHPNIAQIYGIEDRALVMELVEGETLKCPLPLKTALDYARQMAEALEYAHEKGVIHRDLKPSNVMVTPQGVVKVLDFGLAKAVEKPVSAGDPNDSPTVTAGATRAGTILGTAAYMSPEQAAGRAVDKRSDVWSFGVVLWEMLAGARLFQGESLAETLADVLRAQIDLTKLPPEVPEPVRELLSRCLDRDPRTRLRDLGEARVVLSGCLADLSNVTPKTIPALQQRRRWIWPAIAALTAVLAAVAFLAYSNRPKRVAEHTPSQPVSNPPDMVASAVQSAAAVVESAASAVASAVSSNKPKPVPGPERWRQITDFPNAATNPALSRDGRMMAFTVGSGWFMGNNEIYVKQLPDGPATPYTNDGLVKMFPAFSPDGSRIAYTIRGFNTWVVPVLAGGAPAAMLEHAEGLTWIDPHRILFSESKQGTMGVETAEQDRTSLREIYMPPGGMAHFSALSPDGKQLLVVEMKGTGPWIPCRLMPFDGSSHGRQVGPAGKKEQVPKSAALPGLPPLPAQCTAAAWSPDGKWMYFTADEGNGSHIWRQRPDSDMPEQITFGPSGEQGLAVAPDGKSIYTSVGGSQHPSLWIHNEKGDRQISGEGNPSIGVFAKDGTRVYYIVQTATNLDLWFTDLKTGRSALAMPSGAAVALFELSEDGKSVLYGTPGRQLWIAGLDPPTPPRELTVDQTSVVIRPPIFWRASGQLYFLGQQGAETHFFSMRPDGSDLRALPDSVLAGGGDPRFLQVSPDERWLTHGGIASPLEGGPSVELCDCAMVYWSADRKALLYTFRALKNGVGSTVAIPLQSGEVFPSISPGRHSKEELAKLPGAVVFPIEFINVGPGLRSWTYVKSNAQQNIFQIPLE